MLSLSALVVSMCLLNPAAAVASPAPSPASAPAPATNPAMAPAAAPAVSAAPAASATAPAGAAGTELLGQPRTTSAVPVGAAGTGAAPVSATPVGAPQAPPGSLFGAVAPIFGVIVVFFVMHIFVSRREQKKKDAILSGIATGDRVQTFGGIIGNVAEIKDGEVVLRVDEMTNTRIRFAKTAIATILRKHNAPAAELKPNGAKASA